MPPYVPDYIASLTPYPPGKPIEEVEREYGISGSIKLASNENPLGPSPKAVAAITAHLSQINRYPDSGGYYLRRRISEKFSLPFDGIVLGNGSDEIIELLTRAFLREGEEAVMSDPSFLCYRIAVQARGAKPVRVPLRDFQIDLKAMARAAGEKTRLVFLTNPNNPTGRAFSKKEFEEFLGLLPSHVLVALDEAYIEFATSPDIPRGFDYVGERAPGLVVLRTFSKAYGLAGLRIGYGVMHPTLADYLHRLRSPFNTGNLPQIGALAALDDDAFLAQTLDITRQGLEFLFAEMKRLDLPTVPTESNFFLLRTPVPGRMVFEKLLERGVIVRAMDSYGLPGYIRVNVGLPEENARFVEALAGVVEGLRASGDI